ncbi:MAG TPA: alpha/beta hydrolase, partial [Mucilaginibacter sp.]|nr:alpha/beta hydrolase [Mucilaginibacter sp.]
FQSLILPDGRRLSFVEFGVKDGYPVLYFHGTPSSCLEPTMIGDEIFIKHNLRIISPSRPGMGQSDRHNNRTFIDWVKDTVALVDHLNIKKFAILGYSGGAPYTLACALKIPELLTSAVIVSGAGQMNQAEVKNNLSLKHRIFWKVADKFPFLLPIVLNKMKQYRGMPDEEILARAEKNMPKADFEVFKQNGRLTLSKKGVDETFRDMKGVAMDVRLPIRSLGFNLGDINFPITFFHGREDNTVPIEVVEWMVPRIPNAKLVTYQNDGHMSTIIDHFDEIAVALLNQK